MVFRTLEGNTRSLFDNATDLLDANRALTFCDRPDGHSLCEDPTSGWQTFRAWPQRFDILDESNTPINILDPRNESLIRHSVAQMGFNLPQALSVSSLINNGASGFSADGYPAIQARFSQLSRRNQTKINELFTSLYTIQLLQTRFNSDSSAQTITAAEWASCISSLRAAANRPNFDDQSLWLSLNATLRSLRYFASDARLGTLVEFLHPSPNEIALRNNYRLLGASFLGADAAGTSAEGDTFSGLDVRLFDRNTNAAKNCIRSFDFNTNTFQTENLCRPAVQQINTRFAQERRLNSGLEQSNRNLWIGLTSAAVIASAFVYIGARRQGVAAGFRSADQNWIAGLQSSLGVRFEEGATQETVFSTLAENLNAKINSSFATAKDTVAANYELWKRALREVLNVEIGDFESSNAWNAALRIQAEQERGIAAEIANTVPSLSEKLAANFINAFKNSLEALGLLRREQLVTLSANVAAADIAAAIRQNVEQTTTLPALRLLIETAEPNNFNVNIPQLNQLLAALSTETKRQFRAELQALQNSAVQELATFTELSAPTVEQSTQNTQISNLLTNINTVLKELEQQGISDALFGPDPRTGTHPTTAIPAMATVGASPPTTAMEIVTSVSTLPPSEQPPARPPRVATYPAPAARAAAPIVAAPADIYDRPTRAMPAVVAAGERAAEAPTQTMQAITEVPTSVDSALAGAAGSERPPR